MEKLFALIRDSKIEQVIVADEDFIAQYMSKRFECVRIDEMEVRPSLGWSYTDGAFAAPVEVEPPPAPEKPIEKPLRELRVLAEALSADPKMKEFASKLVEVFEVSAQVKKPGEAVEIEVRAKP